MGYSYSTVDNEGQTTVKGWEAEALWRLGDAWLLRATWSHNEGELEDGTPLEYAHCHYRYDHGGIILVNNG